MSGLNLTVNAVSFYRVFPAHPELNPAHPLVVFGDHRFCAGSSDRVMRMPGPHMHSQIEFNFVLDGRMTYWFDGRELTVSAGRLVLFWGMIRIRSSNSTSRRILSASMFRCRFFWACRASAAFARRCFVEP